MHILYEGAHTFTVHCMVTMALLHTLVLSEYTPCMMEDDSLKENTTWLQFPILPAVSLAATLAEYVEQGLTPSV